MSNVKFYARVPGGWIVHPKFEQFQYPGGEWSIVDHEPEAKYVEHFCVVNGANPNDLIVAAMWAHFVNHRDNESIVTLFMPYVPAGRSDRGNPKGVQVYANIINELRLDDLVIIDPHSNDTVIELFGPLVIPVERVIARTVGKNHPYIGVISPDAGAVERAGRAALKLGVPLYIARKSRDFDTGKLTDFSAPQYWEDTLRERPVGKFLVVDDICDGGGTFAGLANALGLSPERLDLWVTHGVFSGNVVNNLAPYGKVFTTDSHPGHTNLERAHITELLPWFHLEIEVNE